MRRRVAESAGHTDVAGRRTSRRLVAVIVVAALGGAIPIMGAGVTGAAGLPKFPGAAWIRQLGPTHLSSPVIADVNGDGHPDVVTSDLSGMLHVLDGRSGRDLPGWPQPIQIIPGQTVASESSPTVADLDKNGRKEIIVGAGSLNVAGQQGGVEAFNANGTARWRIRTQTVDGPERRGRHTGGRRRERRRLSRRRVRELGPRHLRGQPVRAGAARLPVQQSRHDLGLARARTTRRTSAGWTSSSAATRAPAVRAVAGVGPA